ncbi:hypothetical protein O181_025918 [Austropuccinia psidii MF-1]|uniref:Uncharacterized protein n=1 Tax=Austropuccinia psidii MF-1 TaxID=1389203 RepID=A0A9Q3GZJ8_9BASI|nr:hypothetical protein [Austropuccinia psidii MF-1]
MLALRAFLTILITPIVGNNSQDMAETVAAWRAYIAALLHAALLHCLNAFKLVRDNCKHRQVGGLAVKDPPLEPLRDEVSLSQTGFQTALVTAMDPSASCGRQSVALGLLAVVVFLPVAPFFSWRLQWCSSPPSPNLRGDKLQQVFLKVLLSDARSQSV